MDEGQGKAICEVGIGGTLVTFMVCVCAGFSLGLFSMVQRHATFAQHAHATLEH